jgi:two-component system phosphate regulon sensor histidine kinase PhoR
MSRKVARLQPVSIPREENTQPKKNEDFKRLEQQILDLRTRESRLAERAETLEKRNVRLEELNEIKDEFVAIASHQLRTPATAVKQYLGLLLEGYSDPLTDDQKVFLEKAYENNSRQLQIVDDLLAVTQLDLNKMKLNIKKEDLNKIIEEGISSLKDKFERLKQEVRFIKAKDPLDAKVDAHQFRMVIENMLENAANYTPDGGKIIVESYQNVRGAIIIKIKDTGVGIAKADFPKLFQKFSRINNPFSNAVNGTGLGLYYSKRIIELHGGTIEVKSELKKGTTFTITLPASKALN